MFSANSEVFPSASVAVALISVPMSTAGKTATICPCGLGLALPRNTAPSPCPDGSPPGVGTGLAEGVQTKDRPAGTQEGLNDWKRTGYGGPCPPIGHHRYFHKLYALDVLLPDLATLSKAKLESAMAGHVLASAELIGTYQRAR